MSTKSLANILPVSVASKLQDYVQLAKLRLTITVVLSAVLGFLIAAGPSTDLSGLWALIIGGFLVVASSNGINQIIERDFDKLMVRTNNRPVATNRMSVTEAAISCTIAGLLGVYILGSFLNQISGLLGLVALLSYAFLYTPLKRISPVAVFVGAFPGAIPPLLGWAAATGSIGMGGWAIFAIQFIWQFPHFWSIAWILDEDYKRAGYRLLPSKVGKDKKTAKLTIWYIALLIPISITPYLLGITGIISMIVVVLAGLLFLAQGLKFHKTCTTKEAKRLMFYSIIYNPVVLLAFVLDKI
ncbi:MAG: protoheme IX farnesyltransferase [Bacteroidia bacterium]|nr:protoheme IX farnesyltransferase [Bacteroidia bacterium]